jgi:glycosyltransferase involved in cell wall biosynthesis
MHIGINAQLLSFSQNYRNGGVSRYIRYLLTALAQQPGEHTYTVFVNGQDIIERMTQHSQITYVAAPWPESRPAVRVAWEQLVLPQLLSQRHIDILHSPVNVLPERMPRRCASVVTLHDLAFLRFPHILTRSKRIYHRTFTVRSLKRATMLITVSDSTKRDAHELANIPLERIQTVYPCIDERFSQAPDAAAIQNFRAQQGLTDGYILYMSTLEPRKNVPTLIEAYAQLRQRYGIKEKLVLAGSKGWLYDTIFARVQELDLAKEVIFPGFVADTEQTLWYHAASVFAYPSLYEGFGIPVAEALVCGIPVVTSNISSLPEAGSGLALCVDPHDVAALAEALYRAITDSTLRDQCKAMAPTVAQQFSALTMAARTREVYEQVGVRHFSERRSEKSTFVVQ